MDSELLKYKIDNWLAEYFNDKGTYNRIIYDAMYYSLKVGGKRIRPILHILVYSLYRGNYETILPVACAIEMIHTYSLIHDDLPCMDNDDLRRGKPTNHKIFGEAVAVLAGDALLNEAMSIMFNNAIGKTEKEILCCKLISDASGAEGMIGGQVVDILSEDKAISKEEISYMHRKKTGELIKASILSGAILGSAPEEHMKILEQFGENLGLAFQIKDDILDVIGNSEMMGKSVNSDKSNNKCTFVTIYGLESCTNKCTYLTNKCIELLKSLDLNTRKLEDLTQFLLKREF